MIADNNIWKCRYNFELRDLYRNKANDVHTATVIKLCGWVAGYTKPMKMVFTPESVDTESGAF